MKGVVFTEFMELVEDRWGFEMLERVIADAELPNGGVYVSTGTYDHAEIVRMASVLGREVGMPINELVKAFGEHLFGRFRCLYPGFFEGVPDTFTFLEQVHDHIHVEVRKLYPDAELPSLIASRRDDGGMDVHYTSARHFGDLAEGLIAACAASFDDPMRIERVDNVAASGSDIQFRLTRSAA